MSDGRKGSWHLEKTGEDAKGEWVISIDSSPFTIGRAEDCSLVLKSRWLSRHHAEIYTSGRFLWVRDLESTNGTFLNHERISEAELLKDGDLIRFGSSSFHIRKTQPSRETNLDTTWGIELHGELSDPSSYESFLRDLLSTEAVFPHFQPIVRFSDSQTVGYEILGRVEKEPLPRDPSLLLELAASFGLASELSALFREKGTSIGRKLRGDPLLFVNTHPAEIYRMDELEKSLRKIREQAPGLSVIVELNENSVTDSGEMRQLREILKDLGMGLAYDDFGIGQVRLVELATMPPDFLKFHISIIKNIHMAPRRLQEMVATFVKAAEDLGVAPLAEGIELNEESEACRQLGFKYAQGYLYGRPQPVDFFSFS